LIFFLFFRWRVAKFCDRKSSSRHHENLAFLAPKASLFRAVNYETKMKGIPDAGEQIQSTGRVDTAQAQDSVVFQFRSDDLLPEPVPPTFFSELIP
jgi:hypothetical protein